MFCVCFVFLVAFAIAAATASLPACSIRNDDYAVGAWQPDAAVYGANATWIELRVDSRLTARAADAVARLTAEWLAHSCAATWAVASPAHQCAARAQVPVIADWRPARCDLAPFSAQLFWKAVGKRRLVFIGDSLQIQHYFGVRCDLERDSEHPIVVGYGQYRGLASLAPVSFADSPGSSLRERRERKFQPNERGTAIRRPGSEGEVDLFPTAFLFEKRVGQSLNFSAPPNWLPRSDEDVASTILYINVGSWFSVGKLRQEGVWPGATPIDTGLLFNATIARTVQLLLPFAARGLTTVFRSMSPGHTRLCDGGAGEFGALFQWDVFKERDQMVRELIDGLPGFHFLDVRGPSLDRDDAHPGSFEGKDCLHWCFAPKGVLDMWGQLLLMMLQTI